MAFPSQASHALIAVQFESLLSSDLYFPPSLYSRMPCWGSAEQSSWFFLPTLGFSITINSITSHSDTQVRSLQVVCGYTLSLIRAFYLLSSPIRVRLKCLSQPEMANRIHLMYWLRLTSSDCLEHCVQKDAEAASDLICDQLSVLLWVVLHMPGICRPALSLPFCAVLDPQSITTASYRLSLLQFITHLALALSF